MSPNDVLRSLRYILNVHESELVEILRLADCEVDRQEIAAYLRREEEEGYAECPDEILAFFLNGLITWKRGPLGGEGATRAPLPIETPVTNNQVLKKVRVAFELRDTDLIELIEKSGLRVSKTELSAFFRAPGHRNYRECGDQFLRNLFKSMAV